MKIFDRYSLLCFSVALILVLTLFIGGEGQENKKESIIGIVYDIHTTQNGYTFLLEDCDGTDIKCFARIEPTGMGIYSIEGSYSDDGGMLFVSSMSAAADNEL
ncbi:MAG: hypothetical protein FWC52_03105 [Candidatus Methanoplasma sp.]|nr:hypothetical protein [Candidatus Methanoplasma sp.]